MKSNLLKRMIALLLCMVIVPCGSSYALAEETVAETTVEEQEEKENLYYTGLRQIWGNEVTGNSVLNGEDLEGQLISLLDYADQYQSLKDAGKPITEKIQVYVNELLPDTYGAYGLVLGLKGAEPGPNGEPAVESFAPEGVDRNEAGFAWDTESFVHETGCVDATFLVGYVDDKGYLTERDDCTMRGNIGVLYRNVGTYYGVSVDLKVTVSDYVVNENDTYRFESDYEGKPVRTKHHAVIGLYTTGGKPGIRVQNIPWVTLSYEFFESGTETPIEVRGNTSYYDIDEFQAVFVDNTCKGIYVTDGSVDGTYADKNGNIKEVTLESGAHNRCVLNLGWFGDGSSGVGVYSSYDNGVSSYISDVYTANAFTEVFEGSKLTRTFNFQNKEYPGAPVTGNAPEGNIYNSGAPVIRKGLAVVEKSADSTYDAVQNPTGKFKFKAYGTIYREDSSDTEPVLLSNTEYTLISEDGRTSASLTTGSDGIFELGKGEKAKFDNLKKGTVFYAEEIEVLEHGSNKVTVTDVTTENVKVIENETKVQSDQITITDSVSNIVFKNEATAKLEVNKSWKWGTQSLREDEIPDVNIYVGLYKNDGTAISTIVLNKSNHWQGEFARLAVAKNYTVKELRPIKGSEKAQFFINSSGYIGVEADEMVVIDEKGYTVTYSGNDITNTLIPVTLKVLKVNVKNEDVKLPGATFELKNSTETVVENGTTDADGIVEFTNLKPDTYTLTETVAPTGYAIAKDPVSITLSNSDIDNVIVEKIVTNIPLTKLPSTGGHGTYGFTFGGLTLMLGAALMLNKINTRR